MSDSSQTENPKRLDRLAASIQDLQAQLTEEVTNLRARVLRLEQALEEVSDREHSDPRRGSRDGPAT